MYGLDCGLWTAAHPASAYGLRDPPDPGVNGGASGASVLGALHLFAMGLI